MVIRTPHQIRTAKQNSPVQNNDRTNKVLCMPNLGLCSQVKCKTNGNYSKFNTRANYNAPWYLRHEAIYSELGIEKIEAYISRLYNRYEERLSAHPNPEALVFLDWVEDLRPLRKRKPDFPVTPDILKI